MLRNTKEQSVKELFDLLIKSYKLGDKLNEARLRSAWDRLMGTTISQYTQDIFLYNHVLHVKLTSAVLREELSFAKKKMITHINKELGEDTIKDIILR